MRRATRRVPSDRGAHGNWWPIIAIAATAASVGLHAYMAASAQTPAFPFDEITLFQYAKYLSGTSTPALVEGAGYFPAWSFVLAPIWRFTSDPATFYHAAIWIGVLIAAVTIWPLTLVIRRWRLPLAQSATIAALVMCMPSRTVQAAYALSENLLFFLIVCMALAAIRLWERTTVVHAGVFAAMVALTVMTHTRAIVVLPVSVLWLVCLVRRNWLASLSGAAMTAALGVSAYHYSMWLNKRLLQLPFNQGTNLTDHLHTRMGVFARVILGQSWYQIVSSLGVVIVGVLALLVLVRREIREERAPGPAAWLLVVIAAIFALSVLSWSSDASLYPPGRGRLDAWIYGRYIDPFSALGVAAGLAAIAKGLRRSTLAWSAGICLAVIVPTVYWVAPTARTWGVVTPAHIPGILPWSATLPFPQNPQPGWAPVPPNLYRTWTWLTPSWTNENRFWILASLTTLALLAIALVARRSTLFLTALLLVAACAGTILSHPMVEAFQHKDGGEPALAQTVKKIEDRFGTTTVSFDRRCIPRPGNRGWAQNEFAFWLQPTGLNIIYSYEDLGSGLVVGCPDFPRASSTRALRVGEDSSIGYELWVLPGELQDKLKAAGMATPSAG